MTSTVIVSSAEDFDRAEECLGNLHTAHIALEQCLLSCDGTIPASVAYHLSRLAYHVEATVNAHDEMSVRTIKDAEA